MSGRWVEIVKQSALLCWTSIRVQAFCVVVLINGAVGLIEDQRTSWTNHDWPLSFEHDLAI